jgi:hypothetical protein
MIQGQFSPHEQPGIEIHSAYNKIYQLCIGAFQGYTIFLRGINAHHNEILGCYLGVEATGRYQFKQRKSAGVWILNRSHHNIIGGPNEDQRNIISGFYERAIYIRHGSHNIIQGNYIGVDRTGLIPLPNGWGESEYLDDPDTLSRKKIYSGIKLGFEYSTHNLIGGPNPGEGNVICSSYRAGIRLEATGCDSNKIQGNYIGVGADGETVLANGEGGIRIGGVGTDTRESGGPAYNIIGGPEPGAGNVISGNKSSGIQVRGLCHDNEISNNLIGTDARLTKVIPNSHNGVYFMWAFQGSPFHNQLGPGNIIIASVDDSFEEEDWAAVRLDHEGTEFNVIKNNYIGTDPNGTLESKHNSGIIIANGADKNKIGPDNVIAGNKKFGIWIEGENTFGNTITQNKIYDNTFGPIFLELGANNSIEPPIITFIDAEGIHGMTYPFSLVEIFTGNAMNAFSYVGQTVADSTGFYLFTEKIDSLSIVATATDTVGNTSMLSGSKTVPVRITLFKAKTLPNGKIQLYWHTETENNNFGFYIQKSSDKEYWQDVAFVPGAGTTVQPKSYEFTDSAPTVDKIWYRLRQIDFDGNENYSRIAFIDNKLVTAFELLAPYPNPFNASTKIVFELKKDDHVTCKVLNLKGETVQTLLDEDMANGQHKTHWNGQDEKGMTVASGVYIIHLAIKDHVETRKVVFTK